MAHDGGRATVARMRRLPVVLALLAITGVSAPAADAARVTKLRVTTAPSWEQWIERGTATQGAFGFVQTACSRTEPRISYTLAPTTEAPGEYLPTFTYSGISFPATLTGRPEGTYHQRHIVPIGTPVSHPIHFAFHGQSGRDPNAAYFNQLGRRFVVFWLDVDGPLDRLLNLRGVPYRGLLKPTGACAAAGLEPYNVIAIEQPPAA